MILCARAQIDRLLSLHDLFSLAQNSVVVIKARLGHPEESSGSDEICAWVIKKKKTEEENSEKEGEE